MTNIYWPIYKNLESECNKLMFTIHIDDNQLNVYSSKISDLILRASSEIESLSKELYWKHGGTQTGQIKFDSVAIKALDEKWTLSKKVVIISSYNCFQSLRELKPFEKNENRTGTRRLTFSWNNSYQNLKHNRAESLEFGSIKYLFDIMAALFLLNIYYKEDHFDLDKDSQANSFPINLGSDIFSIKLHKNSSILLDGTYTKNSDFDECVYFTKATDETATIFNNSMRKMQEKEKELSTNHMMKVIQDKLSVTENTSPEQIQKKIEEIVSEEKKNVGFKFAKQAMMHERPKVEQLSYEANLNMNQV